MERRNANGRFEVKIAHRQKMAFPQMNIALWPLAARDGAAVRGGRDGGRWRVAGQADDGGGSRGT
jgi:hypothetical protein